MSDRRNSFYYWLKCTHINSVQTFTYTHTHTQTHTHTFYPSTELYIKLVPMIDPIIKRVALCRLNLLKSFVFIKFDGTF